MLHAILILLGVDSVVKHENHLLKFIHVHLAHVVERKHLLFLLRGGLGQATVFLTRVMLVEFEDPSSDQLILELFYLIRFVGGLKGVSPSSAVVGLLSVRDRSPSVSILYVPHNAFTVLVDEGDPTYVDADDRFLE